MKMKEKKREANIQRKREGMGEEIKKRRERGREGRKEGGGRQGEREGRPVCDVVGIPLIWQIYVTSCS